MKKIVFAILLFSCQPSFAQNWQEWTRQKKTQIKYLKQQISANAVYLEFLQKGYTIATTGLHVIGDIKEGDFNLHDNYFSSLKAVNPHIKGCSRIAAIISLQVKIIKTSKQVKHNDRLTHEEQEYCSKVMDNLLEDCVATVEELIMLTTNEEFSMPDDERLQRIDKLYAGMLANYRFCTSLTEGVKILAVQRLAEETEINLSKKLRQ